jgi:hypothetical protein
MPLPSRHIRSSAHVAVVTNDDEPGKNTLVSFSSSFSTLTSALLARVAQFVARELRNHQVRIAGPCDAHRCEFNRHQCNNRRPRKPFVRKQQWRRRLVECRHGDCHRLRQSRIGLLDLCVAVSRAIAHRRRVRSEAVSSPLARRASFQLPHDKVFVDWRHVAAQSKFADAVIIATPDHLHAEPAVAFAALGYHLLLEKPMATSADDCRRIVDAVHNANVMLTVGHVMRFSATVAQ